MNDVLELAKKRGYIVLPAHASVLATLAGRAFETWCAKQGKPVAVMQMEGRTARITVDFLYWDRERLRAGGDRMALLAAARDILRPYAKHHDIHGPWWNVKVPTDQAEQVMRDLLAAVPQPSAAA